MFKSHWLNAFRSRAKASRQLRNAGRHRRRVAIEKLEDRTLLATQVITPTPATQAVIPGNSVSIDVDYSTLDDSGNPANLQATALGLRLHYNSTAVTFDSLSPLFPTGLTAQSDQEDTSDFDGDASTDRYVNAAWFDFGGQWPGTSNTQPIDLYTANFTTAGSFTGSTTLNFTRSTTPAGFPDFNSTPVTITEFITPDLTISSPAAASEGDDVVFTFTLSEDPSGVVTFDYSTAPDTADTSDYTSVTNQPITFNPGGALTQTVAIPTTEDSAVELDETFTVAIANAVNANVTNGTGTGWILNDDVPLVSVADAGTVNEGDVASFEISLDRAPLTDVDVTVSTSDVTATTPGDYAQVTNHQLVFTTTNWDTPQTVTISTNDDTEYEADESFSLNILQVLGGLPDFAADSGIATIAANDFPTVSITDSADTPEDQGALFSVSIDQEPLSGLDLTVDLMSASGTADDGVDYDNLDITLTFTNGGPLTQDVLVATTGDTIVEMDETFSVGLSNVNNGTLGISTGQALILDDDDPIISVSDAAVVQEGDPAVFTVSLDQDPVSPVTVTVDTNDGSATDPDDYTAVSGMILTFNPGESRSQEVSVATIDDAALEFDEDFFLDLSSPTGGSIGDGQGQAIVTSDDFPFISIDDAADVNEGGQAVFTVSLDTLPLTGMDLTVQTTTVDGTAEAGTDFDSDSQTLTFTSAGPLTQQVTIQTNDDTLVEPTEDFTVQIGNANNGYISDGIGDALILSDDIPSLSISDAPSVAEGTDAVFTVTLDQAPISDVSVDVATSDDSAVSPDDFTALPATTLTFTPTGPLTQTVAVATLNDGLVETEETFFLDLTNENGLTLSTNQVSGTIQSLDEPTISIDDAADAVEGTDAVFTVTLDQLPLSGLDVSVTVSSTGGTAEDGTDYSSLNQTLTFTSTGDLTQTVGIAITDDSLVELSEDFVVDLSGATNGSVSTITGESQGSAQILDNDLPAVSIDDVSVDEGTDAVFTVSLDQAPIADVTVTVSTTDDTAVSPDDFTAVTGTVLTFSPGGDLTQQVSVATIDDSLVETSENFFLDITDIQGGTPGDDQGQATLSSDDGPSISISDAADVTEGVDAVFTVSLDQAPLSGLDVTVTVSTDVGTADSSDFTAVSQTLTFTSTDPLTQQVTVTTTDDTSVEVSEDFVVNLTNPGNVGIVDGQGSGIILDNDLPTISIDDVSISEGTDAVFTVSLDQAPVTSLTVTYSTTDGSATSPDDYTAVSNQTLTFDPGGSLTQQVSVTTIDDTDLEADEDFTVDLSNASNVNIGDGQGQATVTSEDVPDISIDDAGAVDEGQDAVFTVSLDQAPLSGLDVTVDVTTVDGTAEAGTDFTSVSQTLTFTSAGPLTQQVSIQTTDDTTAELSEDFTVQIGNPSNGTISDGIGDSQINASDLPAISISDAGSIDEGQLAVFTVSLDQNPIADVTVTLSTDDGTAVAPDDYTAVSSQTLTFTPGGSLSQDVTVSTVDDTVEEADETFVVNLSLATNATIQGNQGTATILASDNQFTGKPSVDQPPQFPDSSKPEITWPAVQGAVSYEVWVTQRFPGVTRLYEGQSIVSTNSFTPPSDQGPGFYKVWVRAIDDRGLEGPWSEEVTYEIKPTLVNANMPTFSARPTFEWDAIPGAPGYEIFIRTKDGDIVVTDIQGTSYTPTQDLAAGPVSWWIRTSDAIFNRGWSDVGKTGNRTELLQPTGSTTDTTPTFTWNAVQGAGRYILHVQNLDTDTEAIREDRLAGTSFTSSDELISGNYRTWVKAVDAATDLFTSGLWSEPVDFSIPARGPQLNTRIVSPTGTTTNPTPEIVWTAAADAVRYELFLQDVDTNGEVFRSDQLTGTSYTPTSNLEGEYRAWVRSIAADGTVGVWGAPVQFNVTPVTTAELSIDSELIRLTSLDVQFDTSSARSDDSSSRIVVERYVPSESAGDEDEIQKRAAERAASQDVENAMLDVWMADQDQIALLVES